jgi:nicotinate-nucleotide adenylyltransferase
MQRLGILGGTFDPPHVGHLILAEYAQDAVKLDRVLFVPAADPPHKAGTRAKVADRLAMITSATADRPDFAVSRVDIDRPGPHYTVDMLRILGEQHPGDELYFIMGGDSLRDLVKWSRPRELIALCKLIVMGRPDADAYPHMHDTALPGLAERVIMTESPMLGVSSSEIAERIRAGRSARYVVPQPVLSYIEANRLYRDE